MNAAGSGLLGWVRRGVHWPSRLSGKRGPPPLAALVCAFLFVAAIFGTSITPYSATSIDFEAVMLVALYGVIEVPKIAAPASTLKR